MGFNLERAVASWQPVKAEGFKPYLQTLPTVSSYPSLRTDVLSIDLLVGEDRTNIKALTAGEASFLLSYRGREGYVSSVQERDDDLEVLQLQGAKQEGYRVTQGMYVATFMADQVYLLATNPDAMFRRITMLPPLILCDNLSSVASMSAVLRIPDVAERYNQMIRRLKMGYSHDEERYIVELPLTSS